MQRLIDRVAETSGTAQARMLGVVLTGMFGLAVRFGAAESNVSKSLLLPAHDAREVRAPTVQEVKVLRAALQAHDNRAPGRSDAMRDLADIGDMLMGTGARIGEVLALRWPENVRAQWLAAVAGMDVSWMSTKSCRKAVATLLEAEVDMEAAKDQLGHADVSVTSKHYVEKHLPRPDRSSVLDAFAQNSE